MTRVLISGSRSWECPGVASRVLARLRARFGDDLTVIHGACPTGVDRCFSDACSERGIWQEGCPADWEKHGKSAGPKRNALMVTMGADFCIACAKDLKSSKGTADCVRRCLASGLPVYLIDSEDAEPRRIREIPT